MNHDAADPDLFRALGDPTRRAVLMRLQSGPQPVHRIAQGFDMSRPAISKHLAILRRAGLVDERREGRENVYAIRLSRLAEARHWLDQFWRARLSALKDLAEGEARDG